MLLICGQSTPERGVIGGTNSCANADGRAVTTDTKGAFRKKLPVAEPPKPCPCVVHVATVTGEQATGRRGVHGRRATRYGPAAAAGPTSGRLAVLATTRLEGERRCSPGSAPRPPGSWSSPSATSARRP